MKLKCVGGPNDGEWFEAPEGSKQGDFVRICQKQEVSIDMMNKMINDPQSISEIVSEKIEIYQIHQLNFLLDYFGMKYKHLMFLGYSNMSLYQVVEHQFRK